MPMDPELAVLARARQQHSLFSLEQAVALGLTEWAVRRRTKVGRFERLLPRVYRIAGAPQTPHQTVQAAVLWAGEDAVLSHRSAGVLWQLDGVTAPRVEVTVPRRRSPRRSLVVVHRARTLPPVDRSQVAGIPVTSAARTIVDLAGALNDEDLETALESGFNRGLYRASFLAWRLDELGGKGRTGAGRLRDLLEQRGRAAAALESRLEVKTWRLLTKSGLAVPERQYPVRVERKHFRLDFAWPDRKVAIECDGYDVHGGRIAFRRDRGRLGELAALGWRVVPITWDDVTQRPNAALDRVRRALAHAA